MSSSDRAGAYSSSTIAMDSRYREARRRIVEGRCVGIDRGTERFGAGISNHGNWRSTTRIGPFGTVGPPGIRDNCDEEERRMQVRNGMSEVTLSVGPGHSLRHASKLMAERKVGAAIVIDPDGSGPGIITERDVLESVAKGQDPDAELVADHLTAELVCAAPDWSLEDAAAAMVRGGFRHLIVVEGGDVAGIVSMRDIVRCWTSDGATSEPPAQAAAG